jgi:hypothetical protein
MMYRAHGLAAVATVLLSGLSFLTTSGNGTAGDEAAVRDDVLKLADVVQKRDKEECKKQAEAIGKKYELEDVMALMRLRAKKGLGLGPTPGAIKPDGIEAMIINLGGRRTPKPKDLAAQGKALEQAAYVTAAIAEVARDKCPVDKKQGDKDPQSWRTWSEEMYTSALELAQAAQAQNPMAVKAAATKLNASCNSCHTAFRD